MNTTSSDTHESFGSGRYVVLSTLGEGGMGQVFLAEDKRLDVKCAIKVLHKELTKKSHFLRFEQEAKTMAKLRHRHVVMVTDYGVDDTTSYIVMELLTGGSLGDVLVKHGVMPLQLAGKLLCGLLDGLSVVHDAGVIHRDIKPANVLLTADGFPKLADFGIAQVKVKDFKTRAGVAIGTANFMAPEQQIDASSVTNLVDIYAVGATFYYLVTGIFPLELHNPAMCDRLLADLPDEISAVIRKACAFEAADRYQSAQEMRAAIEAVIQLKPSSFTYDWAPRSSVEEVSADPTLWMSEHDDEVAVSALGVAPTLVATEERRSAWFGLAAGFAVSAVFGVMGVFAYQVGWDREVPVAARDQVVEVQPEKSPEVEVIKVDEVKPEDDEPVVPVPTENSVMAKFSVSKDVQKTDAKKDTPKSDATQVDTTVVADNTPSADSRDKAVIIREFTVIAKPRSRVFVDGELVLKNTPGKIKTESGEHLLRLESLESDLTYEKTVLVPRKIRIPPRCIDLEKQAPCRY